MDSVQLARFESKYTVSPDSGCWVWNAARYSNGYASFWMGQRTRVAHRVAFEHFVGQVPDGMQLDHLCRNRACVNPAHLEPVTHRENALRGNGCAANRMVTHCPSGHPYDETNTQLYVRNGTYHRRCRACVSVKNARDYFRRKFESDLVVSAR